MAQAGVAAGGAGAGAGMVVAGPAAVGALSAAAAAALAKAAAADKLEEVILAKPTPAITMCRAIQSNRTTTIEALEHGVFVKPAASIAIAYGPYVSWLWARRT